MPHPRKPLAAVCVEMRWSAAVLTAALGDAPTQGAHVSPLGSRAAEIQSFGMHAKRVKYFWLEYRIAEDPMGDSVRARQAKSAAKPSDERP
jgi:hypothetical protein